MKLKFSAFLLLFSTLTFAAIDPTAAYQSVVRGESVIVDVREKHELVDGMIANALWFPTSKLEKSDWVTDFQKLSGKKKIFLYCRSGTRAEKVRGALAKHGITSENLGGFEDLRRVLPVQQAP
jgi:rhodanese-related sulfurtransferase